MVMVQIHSQQKVLMATFRTLCGASTLEVTYSDDFGEDDSKQRLHHSVDDGTKGPQRNVRPLRKVETHHFKERHGGNIFILQKEGERAEPYLLPLSLFSLGKDSVWTSN